ncbi:MAG: hypothetical protein JWP94_2862, partial [Mucilaginibacter sp.]|nr:hypothetical protein [Mucilaginibacter sp.]
TKTVDPFDNSVVGPKVTDTLLVMLTVCPAFTV